MEKEELRKDAIHRLKDLRTNERIEIERGLLNQLLNSEHWKNAKTIGITISQGFEWNTEPIIKAAWEAGKDVCAPKCTPETKALNFYKFTSYNQLEVVYYNLKEPNKTSTDIVEKNDVDLIIVPGVLFDKMGYRIGFGGGYYDRFLQDFHNQTLSLVSTVQLVGELPNDTFDIPVQYIVTESTVFKASEKYV